MGAEREEKGKMKREQEVKEIMKIYRNSVGGGESIWAMWPSGTSRKYFIKNDFDTNHS